MVLSFAMSIDEGARVASSPRRRVRYSPTGRQKQRRPDSHEATNPATLAHSQRAEN